MRRIKAGDMRHEVHVLEHKIESNSTAYDGYGMVSASSTAWKRLQIVRGKYESLGVSKPFIAGQQEPNASHRITIDYLPVLATTGGPRRALSVNGRMLYIQGALDVDFEQRQLQVFCSEVL